MLSFPLCCVCTVILYNSVNKESNTTHYLHGTKTVELSYGTLFKVAASTGGKYKRNPTFRLKFIPFL